MVTEVSLRQFHVSRKYSRPLVVGVLVHQSSRHLEVTPPRISPSWNHARESKHLHQRKAPRTDQRSWLPRPRRPRFSTLYTWFAAFPRQSEPLLEQATRRVEWSQPNANTASLSTGFVSPFLLSLPFAPSQTIFVGTTVIQYA